MTDGNGEAAATQQEAWFAVVEVYFDDQTPVQNALMGILAMATSMGMVHLVSTPKGMTVTLAGFDEDMMKARSARLAETAGKFNVKRAEVKVVHGAKEWSEVKNMGGSDERDQRKTS